MTGTSYCPAGPQISWEAFDDEFVILDLDSGRYFSCAGGAAALWQAVLSGLDPAQIAAALPDATLRQQLIECFEAFQSAGLIRPQGEASPFSAEDLARFAALKGDWRFEAFDDLAALLVADPIHETDREAGWPHQPQ